MHDLDVTTRRRREKWVWRSALGGSVIVHLLVLLLGGRSTLLFPGIPAGPDAGDDRAAAGGLQAVNMVIPPPRPIERPFIPIPVEIDIELVEFDMDQAFDESAFIGELPGPGEVGTETGDGAGNGGTDGEGSGHNPMPVPRMIIPVVETPRGLRDFDLTVWVFVNELGEVVSDSTWLQPPSPDRRYNERLVSEAADWSFRPARKNGVPVAAWFSWVVNN
jgi:hypothetical protein